MVVDIEFLEEKARQIRIEIVKMLTNAGSGHTGGSLSATDIVTALYFYKMKHNPKILNGKNAIDLFFQKDMLHLFFMQHWLFLVILINPCLIA